MINDEIYKEWDAFITKWHEILGSPDDSCWIINCKGKGTIKLMGVQSHTIHWYCNDCAKDLLNTQLFIKDND